MKARAALAETLHFAVGPIFERPGSNSGPLTGRRLIVKDLFHVAGEPTFAGCDMPIEPQAKETASAVRLLRDAGAAYIGKAQMVQLAFGGWGTNACAGPPRNPWDAQEFRVAGGSSSGSAVAVAAGFADLALGSDTGGSIRIPASLCGIVGLKPSQRRVRMDGVVPLAPTLDSVGPMARTVGEVARAFAVLTDEPMVTEPTPLPSLTLRSLTDDDLFAQPDVAQAYRAIVEKLHARGAAVQALPLSPPPGDYVAPTGKVMGFEAWHIHGAHITQAAATADAGVLARFRAVSGIDETSYQAAQTARSAHQRDFGQWLAGADFLLTPATACTAPPLARVDEADFTLAHYTRMANYLDLCAIALPCGYDRDGLPIGLQLVGQAGDESALIAAALSIEAVIQLPVRTPPMHVSGYID